MGRKVEKTRAGNTWTEARFFQFIRSNLRLCSRKWPPIQEAKKAVRRPYVGENKRQKWEYQCADCKGWYADKHTAVDHLIPCGSLRSIDDIRGFVERLFCEGDGLAVRCHACHKERHLEAE